MPPSAAGSLTSTGIYIDAGFGYDKRRILEAKRVKLYTRTGDDGTTGLIGGGRVPKDHARVSAYGEIDELNALLGWCGCAAEGARMQRLQATQHQLFAIGAELATTPSNTTRPSFVPIEDAEVERLEGWIDESTDQVPRLRNFILPGGSEGGARLHVARGVCRRAERAVITLASSEEVRPVIIHYLNRLSDLLFAWARETNHTQSQPEIPWEPTHPQT